MRWTSAVVCGALGCALLAGCGGGGGTGGGGGQQSTITGVTVAVTPTAITLTQTAQATATVTGTGDFSSAVTWSVNPSSGGTITSAGVFTPTTAGSATLVATSSQDSTKSGNASITAISITISGPSTATIGAQAQFTAAVAGATNTNVNWTVAGPSGWTGGVGTIDIPSSTSIVYQTPYPAPPTVTLTAVSAAYSSLSENITLTLATPATAAGPALSVDVGNEMHLISPYIYGMNAFDLDTASAKTANTSVVRWGGDDTSRYNYQNGNTNSASDYYFLNSSGAADMLPNPGGSTIFSGGSNAATGSAVPGTYVSTADSMGIAVLGTMNVQGWVTNTSTSACSFTQSSYPNQQSYQGSCGNGTCPSGSTCGYLSCTTSGGCSLYGDATVPALTAVAETAPACTMNKLTSGCQNGVSTCMVETCTQAALPTPAQATTAWAQKTWAGGWVNSIVSDTRDGYGNGASGKGVAFWDLDNEPAWWDGVHRDVHPSPSTYDEVTWADISTALAIKTIDSTALVDGPIIDFWWNYFYSKDDIENGWGSNSSSPCWQPWSNPVDREAHGGVAMIPYYLQKMNEASTTYNMRLLDYLDIHGYFAGSYLGNSVAFTTAGDTGEQYQRQDSVRALWDPTYTNSNYPQPNYVTDPDYYDPATHSGSNQCSIPLQAPEAIPMLHAWVNGTAPLGDPSNNYPGTKTAIDEYNWGGLESINGAVVQADILGVFGQYGLDMGTLWPAQAYNTQGPGNYAFAMYRNFDLKNDGAVFGDEALASCSTTAVLSAACTPIDASFQPVANMETGQEQLSVYGALRTSDNAITVMVINKTWGTLTSTISLLNAPSLGASASVYTYSNANLTGIATSTASVTPPTAPSTKSTIANYPFPAQSITLFVIPQ
jgi:hypothetical protein